GHQHSYSRDGRRRLSMKKGRLSSDAVVFMGRGRSGVLEQRSSLYRFLAGRAGGMGGSLRWRNSDQGRHAARGAEALAGAKGVVVVSMCQIASERRGARSTWATRG